MTLKEASERFCISMERLTYYEENKLIMYETLVDGVPDYTEEELHKVSIIHDLLEIKLAYLIQRIGTEYRRNSRNKGLSAH